MTFAIPSFRPDAPEPRAIAYVESAADERWSRWIFKAPPLQVQPPSVDLRELGPEFPHRLAAH